MIISLKVLGIHVDIGEVIKIKLAFYIKLMKENYLSLVPGKCASMARKKQREIPPGIYLLIFGNSWVLEYSLQ